MSRQHLIIFVTKPRPKSWQIGTLPIPFTKTNVRATKFDSFPLLKKPGFIFPISIPDRPRSELWQQIIILPIPARPSPQSCQIVLQSNTKILAKACNFWRTTTQIWVTNVLHPIPLRQKPKPWQQIELLPILDGPRPKSCNKPYFLQDKPE